LGSTFNDRSTLGRCAPKAAAGTVVSAPGAPTLTWRTLGTRPRKALVICALLSICVFAMLTART
jgi:hypothetical protein